MWKSNDNITTQIMLKKKGLSLVELIVVTVVIAIAATLAFPTYTIFQQRSKEKMLKKNVKFKWSRISVGIRAAPSWLEKKHQVNLSTWSVDSCSKSSPFYFLLIFNRSPTK